MNIYYLKGLLALILHFSVLLSFLKKKNTKIVYFYCGET